jgi:hypothetical protein
MRADPKPQNGARFAFHADRAVITADSNGHDGTAHKDMLEVKARMPWIRSKKSVGGLCLFPHVAWQRGEHLSERSTRP